MRPTEILMHEHELVVRALEVLGAMRAQAAIGGTVARADRADLIAFFREFLDGCHHRKEEQVLFPALAQAGLPVENGPIGVMLHEHETGRQLVRALADDGPSFTTAAADFDELLRAHINKENMILFRMADRLLPRARQDEIVDAFGRVDGDGVRWTAIVDRLAATWLPPRRAAV